MLQKDPSLIEPEARPFAHLPGGHQEGWPDANRNVMQTVYDFIASGKKGTDPKPAAMATFEDGYPCQRHRRGHHQQREAGQRLDEG